MRLGGEDTAWLHMSDETNPMIVNAVIELDGTLDTARVWSILETRGLPPRFRARVVERRRGLPELEPDPAFDVAKHLVHVEIEPGDDALREFVSREVSTMLDPDRPLWRTIVIDREGGPTALLFRVHHALADGFALLEQLFELCDERAPTAPVQATHGSRRAGPVRQAEVLARMVTLPSDPYTALKHELGVEKNVAWSHPMSLDEVKRVAHASGATVNDVLVAVVSGALGRELDVLGESVSDVRAMVPVNLRRASNVELGNRFGLVILALPVGLRDPRLRLDEVKARMDGLKASPEAYVGMGLLRVMGWLPRPLEELGASFFAKKSSLVLTNVPGPREPLHLGGVTIARIMFWVPQAARLGLGVSIFSYAGQVTMGVIADTRVLARPESLVRAMDDEMAALSGAVLRKAS
jgi:diacylglycerol O-acyltransferase / wax synthase